jgi:hypothetical protein
VLLRLRTATLVTTGRLVADVFAVSDLPPKLRPAWDERMLLQARRQLQQTLVSAGQAGAFPARVCGEAQRLLLALDTTPCMGLRAASTCHAWVVSLSRLCCCYIL